MTKQKAFWGILITTFIFSFTYFLIERYIPPKSNITKEQTQESMKELEEKYNTKEIIIVFKEGVSLEAAKEIISYYDGKIVEYLPEIQNYVIKLPEKTSVEESLYTLEELTKKEEVSLAMFNHPATPIDEEANYFNDEEVTNNTIFEEALAIYKQPSNVFYSSDGNYTFLYPSKWTVSENDSIHFKDENKSISYVKKDSKIDLYEDVINDHIDSEIKEGLTLDSELDIFEVNDLIYIKWIMKKDEVFLPRGLIQNKNYYYLFEPNENVSLDEFSLIIDSFVINQ